ncbi:hypothetical protein FLLO111716_06480 [Flavobacterium longum]|uniref:DUF7218 family protein n=1 Tax=Flavobacterium longum TaxID=1299340 RepID=UPI0039E871D3
MPGKSPGPQIKDKDQYEALRDKGYSRKNQQEFPTVKEPSSAVEKPGSTKTVPRPTCTMKHRKSVSKDGRK